MKDLTHLSIGAAVGVVCTGFDSAPDAVGWAALLVGSLLPDIDHKRSFVGKYVPWLSATLERKYGHRTLTHSLLGFALFALLLSPTLLLSDSVLPWALIGIASHVLLDTFNIQGVPLFYPFARLEFVAFHNRAWRIPYGSPAEMTMLALVSLCTLALLPLAAGGFSPAFHRMVGSTGATVEDFQRWRDDFKVYAVLNGDAPLQREAQIDRKYRILDALAPELLLVEDESGRAFRVASGTQAGEAEMWAFRVSAEKGEAITVRRWTVDMTGRSINDLLRLLPDSGEMFVNADLLLSSGLVSSPVTGEFSRAQASGSMLTLRSAKRADLASIRNAICQSGVALVRAEFGNGKVEELASSEVSRKFAREVVLEKLPDLGACLVDVGDQVTEGQALVRNAHKTEIESEAAKLADAQAQLVLAAATLQEQEESAAAELNLQRGKIGTAKREVEKVRWLVERGARTVRELETAEEALQTLVDAEHRTLRVLHAQRLEARKRRITLQAIERGSVERLNVLKSSEWSRCPIDGTVTAVRVESVGVDGIDVVLELVQTVTHGGSETNGTF